MSDAVLPNSQPGLPSADPPVLTVQPAGAWRRRFAFSLIVLTRLLILIKTILLSPFTLLRAVRRSMTGASATLLIVSIVSLNIIWGYPWTGMFAACMSLMGLGWVVSQLMRPRLAVDFSLPRLCPAGQPFSIVTHVMNRRQLPAMDLRIGFHCHARSRGASTRGSSANDCIVVSSDQSMGQIPSSGRIELAGALQFDQRGMQAVPDVVVRSMFPFHLFRTTTRFHSRTHIAITPRPLSGDEDSVSRELLQALGGWSHKLLSGDALDYTGSREYQSGMPVRRWDFASWARLGRPIVREFQSPSVQMVSLLVDTSTDESADSAEADELLERILSVAATAIIDLTSKAVRIRLYITHEEPSALLLGELSHVGDNDALLIRLAGAERVATSVAADRTRTMLERLGNDPALVLTSRDNWEIMQHAGQSTTLLRIDIPRESGEPLKPNMLSRGHRVASRETITNGRSR